MTSYCSNVKQQACFQLFQRGTMFQFEPDLKMH